MTSPAVTALGEAMASTALTHNTGCPCLICRAAHGDAQAFAEVIATLARLSDDA